MIDLKLLRDQPDVVRASQAARVGVDRGVHQGGVGPACRLAGADAGARLGGATDFDPVPVGHDSADGVELAVQDDNNAQGKTSTPTFTWEARDSGDAAAGSYYANAVLAEVTKHSSTSTGSTRLVRSATQSRSTPGPTASSVRWWRTGNSPR